MILILPLLIIFILIILEKQNLNLIIFYTLFIYIYYNLNITIGINTIQISLLILILYLLLNNENNKNLYLYIILFLMNTIFIFNSNSLLAVFISIELISFLMITFINLFILNKYPGILYYLFSALFTAIFILSLGYLYIGYTIGYSLLSLVFIWKLGIGPFHILLPYIYNELSPKKIIFIDIICKYLLFYIFNRLIINIPINLHFIALISIIIGSILILKEYNLLNILVYSSIINYGLLLISMSNITIFYIYIFFYSLMVILYLYLITHIWIIYSINNNYYIIFWFLLLLNMIGIPPLNGFWIKYYVLQLLILNQSYFIIFIILISLILLSLIYIRILLNFFINDKIIDIYNNNIIYSHFFTSILIILSFPLFII